MASTKNKTFIINGITIKLLIIRDYILSTNYLLLAKEHNYLLKLYINYGFLVKQILNQFSIVSKKE